MEIGNKIKKVRELRNYTQEYMAQKMNISQASYSRFEASNSGITFSQLTSIATVLEMKVEDLIAFDEKMIFNNYGTANDKSFSVITEVSSREVELYQKTISLLEDKIKSLEKELDLLK